MMLAKDWYRAKVSASGSDGDSKMYISGDNLALSI